MSDNVGDCPFCTGRDETHPRCARCEILIGPGHHQEEYTIRGNDVICTDCAKRLQRGKSPNPKRIARAYEWLRAYYLQSIGKGESNA
ncbi:MAG: hypothetical protein QUS09_05630 [Methanotrichaceae archaeon]|nr:hypothetical protein [Methanotrichaceae archaeon]